MAATMREPYVGIWASENRKVLGSEIKALREAAEQSADQETLLILDFLEHGQDVSSVPLKMALIISARLAAARGLSQRQWMQELLSRHATDREQLETLWRTLVDLQVDAELPWLS